MKLILFSLTLSAASAWAVSTDQTPKSITAAQANAVQHGRIYINMPRQPLSSFVRTCSDLVQVRVVSVTPTFPKAGLPHRSVELQILRAMKGMEVSKLTIEVVGASDEQHDFRADRAPEMKVGQELVVFLWRDANTGVTGILGLGDGTYEVERTGQDASVVGLYADHIDVNTFFETAAQLWNQ